jgi:predicted component of type VI protein secretion system
MDYQLVLLKGRSASTAIKLADGVTTAGRQEDCQLRIKSSQVSRKHCQLFEKNGMLLVKDLGSANGTFVNGKKVDTQRVMEPGDELTIGSIVFRVEKVGQPLPSKPVAAATAQSDTGEVAVAELADDDFEIDFDEGPASATSAVTDDFDIDLDDMGLSSPPPAVKAAPALEPVPAPTPEPVPAPTVKKGSPSLADSTKPRAPEPVPLPIPEEKTVADDAVADFLSGIKFGDDDD